MLRAKIQSTKEPTGICFSQKRPDGMSLIPWEKGRCLTWYVTIADTFADSYIKHTAEAASAAAERAAINKTKKYEHLAHNFIFVPIAYKITGAWCTKGLEFVADLGSKILKVTGDTRETFATTSKDFFSCAAWKRIVF